MRTTNVLDEESMRDLGFTDHREGFWYLCAPVASNTTLNITINKETGEWEESVLDEFFLQHAPYMDAKPEFRDEIIRNVDLVIDTLSVNGMSVEVNHSLYTWKDDSNV